ncbi:hypothetical protein [Microbispora bryophytorum]|uniref:Uncharacterized protein n=1 Tax=Microbispora bryophytorum TaxID=1460882 RepID=A0A8H9GXE5_9ACTN|nr:hypothetical protein [Microbispora bryophytorum]MBD3140235.1 hypothetical protein [Microbispora bryophytorum]TQS02340.1 hypothetical protein FLX07_29160 [Microbispora bryophytorum]GGO06922.1 hypothetical protein GCM10011574_19960 [Microbispora bryophytorum]
MTSGLGGPASSSPARPVVVGQILEPGEPGEPADGHLAHPVRTRPVRTRPVRTHPVRDARAAHA